ncbi:mechanosensitive ion channel family protein [Microbacterium sp.]|uniref:mechanosensitive ion channel family protein n=1 Tax=Microbacterium sp. TaxID=51671 RepID=UPI003A84AB25
MEDQIKKWTSAILDHLPALLIGVALVVVSFLLATLARRIARRAAERADVPGGVQKVIARTTYAVTLGLGLIVAVSVGLPGINLGAAFGALGIGSIIAGFALKDIIENWVAGTLILFTRPFVIGDQIQSGTDEGTVRDIQFRATILQTYDHRAVVIPNSELYTGRVTVNTRYEQVRHKVPLTFPNGYEIEPLRTAITEVLTSVDNVANDPAPDVMVTELGDYSTTLTARFWVGPPGTHGDVTHVTNAILTALFDRFGDMGLQNIRPEMVVYDAGAPSRPASL